MSEKLKPFEWTEQLVLGVDSMDKQHHHLVNLINLLVDELNKDNSTQVKPKFETLCQFVVKHFQDEESLMQKEGFVGVETHKVIHKQLLDKVGVFAEALNKGTLDKAALMSFLTMWLKSHIMGIDRKYGDHIKSKKAA
ncbi:MAG: hypothetical protein Fur0010_11690 [Bdellovibrio sp.]